MMRQLEPSSPCQIIEDGAPNMRLCSKGPANPNAPMAVTDSNFGLEGSESSNVKYQSTG